MSQRTAAITSLPMAFEVAKAMQADGLEWGEGYRPLCRHALEDIAPLASKPFGRTPKIFSIMLTKLFALAILGER